MKICHDLNSLVCGTCLAVKSAYAGFGNQKYFKLGEKANAGSGPARPAAGAYLDQPATPRQEQRTLAVQISEEMFQQLKSYLDALTRQT